MRKYIADSRVLGLIEVFLQAEIMDGVQHWTPESGAPQGAVLSPLLSNLYLNALDHLHGQPGVRDDTVCGRSGNSVPQSGRSRHGPWRWCKRGRPNAA